MSSEVAVAAAAVLFAILAAMTGEAEAAYKLPSSFKRCSAGDPKINECLRFAVEDAFRKMKDGVPSLGVLPVDPLRVDRIHIDQGQGSVTMKMDLRNITMSGLAGTKITNYSADLPNGILRTESMTPFLRLNFNHVVTGRILLLPIRGAGPGTITMTNVVTKHYLKYVTRTKKDGKKYWNMQEYAVKIDPKDITLDLQGLFGGDGRIGDQLNAFINQNARLIFDEIGGAFEEAFGGVFKEITSRVFNKVAFNDIFISDQ